MKNRAILSAIIVILLLGTTIKSAACQDTIYTGSFPSAEDLKAIQEQMKVMEFALQEQFKALDLNSESLEKNLESIREQLENMPKIEIPEDFMKEFQFNFERNMFATTVKLEGESGKKEVVIVVEEENPFLHLNINGSVKTGSVRVEIIDPSGKRQGSFTIENSDNGNGEMVNSSINKNIKNPSTGKWKIQVTSEKATGNIYVSSMQMPLVSDLL